MRDCVVGRIARYLDIRLAIYCLSGLSLRAVRATAAAVGPGAVRTGSPGMDGVGRDKFGRGGDIHSQKTGQSLH